MGNISIAIRFDVGRIKRFVAFPCYTSIFSTENTEITLDGLEVKNAQIFHIINNIVVHIFHHGNQI